MTSVLFRFRVVAFVLLYLLGFFPPWRFFGTGSTGTFWLAASALLARTGWLNLATASQTITTLALGCLLTGTALRVWGTAFLGSSTMRGSELQGQRLIAAGPYEYVRNPLYLGAWLMALATSLLMPVDGAVVFLIAFTLFVSVLIRLEERFLADRLGEPTSTIAALFRARFRGSARIPQDGQRTNADWLRAMLDETYPITFTVCFAIFAWRYNAQILIRCLLICYGASLVVRALTGTWKAPPAL